MTGLAPCCGGVAWRAAPPPPPPDVVNHLFPVLNIWALVPKASDWGFWGPIVAAIFSEYHGPLPLAGLVSLASPWPGHTSYCVHQPRLVTHPVSPLAAANQISISFQKQCTPLFLQRALGLSGGAVWGSPYPVLQLNEDSLRLIEKELGSPPSFPGKIPQLPQTS